MHIGARVSMEWNPNPNMDNPLVRHNLYMHSLFVHFHRDAGCCRRFTPLVELLEDAGEGTGGHTTYQGLLK